MEIKENKIRHQYKSSECGVYCINFITKLLEGKTFNQIINYILKQLLLTSFSNSLNLLISYILNTILRSNLF